MSDAMVERLLRKIRDRSLAPDEAEHMIETIRIDAELEAVMGLPDVKYRQLEDGRFVPEGFVPGPGHYPRGDGPDNGKPRVRWHMVPEYADVCGHFSDDPEHLTTCPVGLQTAAYFADRDADRRE